MRTSARRMMILLGPGLSFGGFSPGDVNQYIDDKVSGYTVQSGFSGMILNIVPRVTASFSPIEYVQIEAVGEIGWGPKMIDKGSSTDLYSFVRYSGGVTVTGHIPLKSYRFSLFGGAGFVYHWMSFEEHAAGTPGARALLGFRMYNKVFTPEIVLMFDYASANDGPFNLNYTGVTLGVNFNFRLFNR
jgi:hypothetical protein